MTKPIEFFEIVDTDRASSLRQLEERYTPFSTHIDVSDATLERLLALYRAGHLPVSVGLREMALGLDWHDCVELDLAIALNIFIEVRSPDGQVVLGYEITEGIDFGNPRSSQVGGVAIPARKDVFSWWRE